VRIGKDAVSRVAQRLEEELSAWRSRPLQLACPCLYLDAAYFKVNWGGRGEALTYLDFPGVHQRHIKSTNVLERLIREVKRRTRVVGVFPGEGSLVNLATVVMLRATEDWAFRRCLDMGPLWAAEEKPTKIAT